MVGGRQAVAVPTAIAAATLGLWVVPPIGWLLTAIVWVLVAPLPRFLLGRVVLLAAVFTLGASLWLQFASGITSGGLQLAGTALNVGLLLVAVSGRTILATIDWAAGLVLFGGAVLFAQQIWVERALNKEQLLSIVATTGDDKESHFTLFANTLLHGAEPWATSDGGVAQFAGYPGGHTAVSVALARMFLELPGSPARVDLLFPYVVTNAMIVSLAGIALGMIAVGVARGLSLERDASNAGLWAALIVMLAATADTLVYPLAAYGHGNMLFGACLTAALAWLATSMVRSSVLGSIGILLVLAYLGWVTWPPVALVAFVPGLAIVWRIVGQRLWLAAGLVGLAVAGTLVVAKAVGNQFGTSIGSLATAPGGNAGFNLSVVVAGIGVCVPMWVWARPRLDLGQRTYLAVGWLPLATAAVAFGAVAADRGVSWQASYYTMKMLNVVALWFAPVLAAVLGSFVCLGLAALKGTGLRPYERAAAGISVAAVIVAGSGYFGPGATGLKDGMYRANAVGSIMTRQSVAGASPVGADLVKALRATAAFPESVAVLANDSDLMHNRWLATLRSVPSMDADRLFATTMTAPDSPTLYAMIVEWLRAEPSAKVVAVCTAVDGCPELADQLQVFGDRAALVQPG